MSDSQPSHDWIDLVTRLAGFIGMNPVRTRWRLMAWRESWKSSKNRAQNTVEHIRYQHKICPHCGALQDASQKTCSDCGKALSPRFWEMLKRVGLVLPQFNSISSLLSFIMILIYIRMVFYGGPGGILAFDSDTLIHFGAHWRGATEQGEFWRISTAIFLHAGLLHITFNLIALMQIGPVVEQIFGRGRTLFFFMVTGILGNMGSELWFSNALAIGASGAIMGLMGIAAGWGQRDGTFMGRNVRDQMVKWLLYTVVFGIFIHADNAAHLTGFVGGAIFGYFYKPQWGGVQAPRSLFYKIETVVGILLMGITVFLVFVPPVSG